MPKQIPMKVIPFRLPADLIKRLDKHAERMQAAQPGLQVTRADALRVLLTEALDREEARRDKA
jgi:predicted transcriptional regulator